MSERNLSAYPRFSGLVVHGDKRGRTLGFPTANIALDAHSAIDDDGVYACWARIFDTPDFHGATVSVGTNPTFDDVRERRVEAFIHDLDCVLYGRRIEFFVVARLRDMLKFPDVEALVEQTRKDVGESRTKLASQYCRNSAALPPGR